MNRASRIIMAVVVVVVMLIACTLPTQVAERGATTTASAPARATGTPTPPPETEYTPVTSATIGSGGGPLKAEGFPLTVPARAWATDAELKLSVSA